MMNLIIGYLLIGTVLSAYEYCNLLIVAKKLNIDLNNCTTLSKKETVWWILGIIFQPITTIVGLISKFFYSFVSDENKDEAFKSLEADAVKDPDIKTTEDYKLQLAIWKKKAGIKEYWK